MSIIGSNKVSANTNKAADKTSTSSEEMINNVRTKKRVTRNSIKLDNPGLNPKLFFKLAAGNFPKVSQDSVKKHSDKQRRKEFLESFKGVGKSPIKKAKVKVPFLAKNILTKSDEELREELIKIRESPKDSDRIVFKGNPYASGRTIFHPLGQIEESPRGRISERQLTDGPTVLQRIVESKRPHSQSSGSRRSVPAEG